MERKNKGIYCDQKSDVNILWWWTYYFIPFYAFLRIFAFIHDCQENTPGLNWNIDLFFVEINVIFMRKNTHFTRNWIHKLKILFFITRLCEISLCVSDNVHITLVFRTVVAWFQHKIIWRNAPQHADWRLSICWLSIYRRIQREGSIGIVIVSRRLTDIIAWKINGFCKEKNSNKRSNFEYFSRICKQKIDQSTAIWVEQLSDGWKSGSLIL